MNPNHLCLCGMEYKTHLQCQTCLVQFDGNPSLLDHIDKFKVSTLFAAGYLANGVIKSLERQLLVELENCRMHIASINTHNEKCIDDELGTGEEEHDVVEVQYVAEEHKRDEDFGNDGEGYDEYSNLHCPFGECKDREAFTTRSNLVRHYQQRA